MDAIRLHNTIAGASLSQARIRLPTQKKPKPKLMHDYLYGHLGLDSIKKPQNEPDTQERENAMNIYAYFVVTLDDDGNYDSVEEPEYIVGSSAQSARDKAVASATDDRDSAEIGETWDVVVQRQ